MSYHFTARIGAASAFGLACSLTSLPLAAAQPVQLPAIDVNAPTPSEPPASAPLAQSTNAAAIVQKYQLPQHAESITAAEIETTVNLRDPEDAVKYLPSLFVRKRYDGDTQAVLATRTWGVNSSARTLIYADDILLSALINNNNTNGSPHWNLVAPESIARIDYLEGPYAAAYPGNSIGGVLLITTKMPDHLFMSAKQTESVQPFSQYGTHDTYLTHQTSAALGDRLENFSWAFNANYQDVHAQPLTYTTSGSVPAGTNGTFLALNKQGVTANVVGTGALIHSQQATANLKLAYDFTPWLQGRYTLGFWSNEQSAMPVTYLTSTATGAPTFGGVSGFASNQYEWTQRQLANAVSVASDTRGPFDFDLSASTYDYLTDIQRSPFTVTASGAGYSQIGKIARMDGTNWQNLDAKGIYRPFGINGAQEVSFGLHTDRYTLVNPTYQSALWNSGPDFGTGQLYSSGMGKTQTSALWLQDLWKIRPDLKLTLGARLETWRAFDGSNLQTTTSAALSGATVGAITGTSAAYQPEQHSANVSPKATLSWSPTPGWEVTGSFGEAYRYPTVGELYQIVTSGSTLVIPNPNLTPEHDLSGEVAIERKFADGKVRLSFFEEYVRGTLISQTNFVNIGSSQLPVTSVANVDATRNQGVELAAQKNDVLIKGLEAFGNITYVDARILSDPSWAGTNPLTGQATTVVGKRVPYVPDWRATLGLTYRPDAHWAFTVAARYSGKQYSTMDNTDIIPHVYGAFDRFIVADLRIHYDATENVSFNFGIDNLNNEKYFLFHPFPQRTFVADARIRF